MEMATRRREQEVWQACDDLWALHGDFKNLTGDAIRERLLSLGKSRGSPNEIYKYRKSWSTSRGVLYIETKTINGDDDDPITRAVRLVHEKLQADTHEQINSLKEEFTTELSLKDDHIIKLKTDLSKLVEEFSKAEQEILRLSKDLNERNAQLEAEIAVRKAAERELLAEKKEKHECLKAQAQVLLETKEAHQSLILEIKALFSQAEEELKQKLQVIEQEKKELGHQFSEQLNELRFKEYNQKQNITILNEAIEKLKAKDDEQTNINNQLKTKLESAKTRESSLTASIALLKADLEERKQRQIKEHNALRKREHTIARLRAMLARGDKSCH